jgi:hypothetical protein
MIFTPNRRESSVFSGVAHFFGVKRGEQPLFRGSSASKSLALFWFSFGVKREHPSACAHNIKKRPALPVEMRGAAWFY